MLDGVHCHPRAQGYWQPISLLDGISFRAEWGQSIGVLGRSGSGKTTLAMVASGLLKPDRGVVLIHGKPPATRRLASFVHNHPSVQMVFQNPYDSFNPASTVVSFFERILRLKRGSDRWLDGVSSSIESLGLPESMLARRPSELSGGQCQRASLALCLASGASCLVLDEPTSMLDQIARSQIISLLRTLHMESSRTFLTLSHDFDLLEKTCDELVVLDEGRIVEQGETSRVIQRPDHVTTRSLIRAAKRLRAIAIREP